MGYPQQGIRAPVEGAQQPTGRRAPFLQVSLGRRIRRGRQAIALVDREPRQALVGQFDMPAARPWFDGEIRNDRHQRAALEGKAGARIEATKFGDHRPQARLVHIAPLHQPIAIAAREEFEIVDQMAHRIVQAAAIGKLQCQALGQAAGENARRIELLEAGQ